MPITLITGTPGAGKTLFALETLLKALKIDPAGRTPEEIKALVREQKVRPVVVIGVEGLMPGLFEEWADPLNWQDAEDGTLFLVDEVWKWLGSHDLSRKQDPRVLAFAEHRHRGMDFIFTCQMPSQLLAHIRGLVSPHFHVTRKFNTSLTLTYEWPHIVDDPNSIGMKDRAQERPFKHPKHIFDLYQSATMHTMKRRIPPKLVILGAGVAAMLAVVGFSAWRVLDGAGALIGEADAAPAAPASTTSPSRTRARADAPSSPDEWAAQFEPRIRGIPASAPAYDGQRVQDYPRVFCMVGGTFGSDTASCKCYSQQATRLDVPHGLCLVYVQNGLFDPYRRPERAPANRGERDSSRTVSEAQLEERPRERQARGAGQPYQRQHPFPDYVPPGYGPRTEPTAQGYVGGR